MKKIAHNLSYWWYVDYLFNLFKAGIYLNFTFLHNAFKTHNIIQVVSTVSMVNWMSFVVVIWVVEDIERFTLSIYLLDVLIHIHIFRGLSRHDSLSTCISLSKLPFIRINCSVHLNTTMCGEIYPDCSPNGAISKQCFSDCVSVAEDCGFLFESLIGQSWPIDCAGLTDLLRNSNGFCRAETKGKYYIHIRRESRDTLLLKYNVLLFLYKH